MNRSLLDLLRCLGCGVGVLQNMPQRQKGFAALPLLVRPGGKFAVGVYPKLRRNALSPKDWSRASVALGRIGVSSRPLQHVVPVVDYQGIYPLSEAQLREWAVLDTFDMLASAHDYPQSAESVTRWFGESGMRDVEVFRAGHLVGRGVRAQP